MKVYFIGSGYDGCYYVRCMVPLFANGWWGERVTLGATKDTPEQSTKACLEADIIVFQRPLTPDKLQLAKLLKAQGKKIVMDNDDTYRKDSGVPIGMTLRGFADKIDDKIDQLNKNLAEFAEFADLITVSTEFLKKEYAEYGDKVVVLPNCIDPSDWMPQKKNESGRVRIGLVVSVANQADYTHLIPTLREINKRNDVQLVLFALPADDERLKIQRSIYKEEIDFWNSLNVEWQPWVNMEYYIRRLQALKLDIMLIPRHDNYFNRCKSNLKFLEAAMMEVPVIAQGFEDGESPYQQDIEHGENGFICVNDEEWLPAIELLVDNKDLREQVGKASKQYVLEHYDIALKKHLWKEAYKNI